MPRHHREREGRFANTDRESQTKRAPNLDFFRVCPGEQTTPRHNMRQKPFQGAVRQLDLFPDTGRSVP
eukprot:5039893-Amphidinium_carterae.1